MKPLKVGIIGAGGISRKMADAVRRSPEYAELIGVAARSMERAKLFAEEYSIPHAYDSYDALCQSDVDLIYIGNIHPCHYDSILLCVRNKKHILCEKPLVLSKKQAEEVCQAAESAGVFLMEAMWTRFLPAIMQAKKWVHNGAIGELTLMEARFSYGFDPNDKSRNGWPYNPDLAGGGLFDVGVYPLMLTTFLTGQKPVSVGGCADVRNGYDAMAAITLKFPNHAVASLSCGVNTETESSARIYGTAGYIDIPASWHDAQTCKKIIPGQQDEIFFCPHENGFVYELIAAVNGIRAGKLQSEIMPHKDSIDCCEIFDTLRKIWGLPSMDR